jgi:hypothetical protein
MTKKKHDKPLRLDMSFDEALKRLAHTDPRDLATGNKKPKKKRTLVRNGVIKQPADTHKT